MIIEKIDVYDLRKTSYLTSIRCADFAEEAAVCLDHMEMRSEVVLNVEGDLTGEFEIIWGKVSQEMRDSRSDMANTVESGHIVLQC